VRSALDPGSELGTAVLQSPERQVPGHLEAVAAHLPTVCEWVMARNGCLIGYGPNLVPLLRRVADYVARILRGTPPGELPIEQPALFEFVVNLKTAKQLGLTIPAALLAPADKVIE
jgi:putative tryptophan/tyrosine transport system substrate-binding protein